MFCRLIGNGDRVYNPAKESIPDILKKRFRDSRIAVHVIGFQIADKEEAEARKHFEVLKELTPRGSFAQDVPKPPSQP